MSSFLYMKSIEVPINRYKCILKLCDVVEGLLAGDVWEALFVMAVPTLTSPTVMNPTEETFVPHSIFQLIIYICTSGRVCVDK